MKLDEMVPMMKDFFLDYLHYRKEVRKHDIWIKKYAHQKGYRVNPHQMLYMNLKIWLAESEKTFGKRYCPCFEPGDDAEINRGLLCPCNFAEAEMKQHGTCHCVLFGREDLTSTQFKEAEARLMQEYRGVPLKLENGVLDTRGMPKEPMRGLPVPDSLHQVKRGLSRLKGNELTVIVETSTEAENLRKFAALREMGFRYENDTPEPFRVVISPRAPH